jgi:hypothetical protein
MGDQLVGCPNIADCLRTLVNGVVIKGQSPFHEVIYSSRTPGADKPMVIIIDGIEIDQTSEFDPLASIAAIDIYSIEVLQKPQYLAVYGSRATGGALVITTRRGDERNNLYKQPGLTTYKFDGFYRARQFYSPKYDVKPAGSIVPDYRTTIFWNPVLIADKDGNASFDFYNSDAPGNYRVVVEGIDSNGDLGRAVYRYTVR